MSSSSSSKLIQVISYAINSNSSLPLVSRMHLYDAMNNYLISQEDRISILENKLSQFQIKLESYEKQNSDKKQTSIHKP
jgi:hypothetical protein